MQNLRLSLAMLALTVSGLTLRVQTAPQTSDQNQTSSGTAKKDSRKEPADASKAASTPAAPGGSAPMRESATPLQTKPARKRTALSADVMTTVWVNTESGIYHKPGSRYYGKTKKGKYMTEADARKAGYREAKKE